MEQRDQLRQSAVFFRQVHAPAYLRHMRHHPSVCTTFRRIFSSVGQTDPDMRQRRVWHRSYLFIARLLCALISISYTSLCFHTPSRPGYFSGIPSGSSPARSHPGPVHMHPPSGCSINHIRQFLPDLVVFSAHWTSSALHWNTSRSSAASRQIEIARSFGLWNCFSPGSSLNSKPVLLFPVSLHFHLLYLPYATFPLFIPTSSAPLSSPSSPPSADAPDTVSSTPPSDQRDMRDELLIVKRDACCPQRIPQIFYISFQLLVPFHARPEEIPEVSLLRQAQPELGQRHAGDHLLHLRRIIVFPR